MKFISQCFRVLLCAMLVNALTMQQFGLSGVAEASAPGTDLFGFGGATAPPRMFIIMDTSRSMADTPSVNGTYPYEDYNGETPTDL